MLTHDPALRRYLTDIAKVPRLSPAEETRLLRAVAAGDTDARNRVVEANLDLVVSLAQDYAGLGVDVADLVQEGNLGLLKAAQKFDPGRGAPFRAYATWWVHNAVCTALTRFGHPVRIPERITRAASAVRRAEQQLLTQHGGGASRESVAAAAGVPQDVVDDVNVAYLPAASLESAPEHAVDEEAFAVGAPGVRAACDALDSRRRRVVELRFGLDGAPPRSLREVGEQLGVSKQRARDLEASALAQLRRHILSSWFDEVA